MLPSLKISVLKAKENSSNDLELQNRQNDMPLSTETVEEPAVLVKHAFKHYGTKKNPLVVLDGLDMAVPQGTIYGLLGASGCGKTTLLSCILGQRKLDSGEILLLGEPLNENHSGFIGAKIGYMPQETALYGDFTIQETLVYFGWVAGMNNKQIEERSKMLIKLIQLPNVSKRIKNLSGGEQRRVSLAAALLHKPKLLILDEPTIGTDSLLRETIWKHLKYISSTENTTVIITTHYIEEARQAHTVALMRDGKFLAEEAPEKLLIKYGNQTLEEVFLKLSVLQNVQRQEANSLPPQENSDACNTKKLNYNAQSKRKINYYLPKFKKNHMKALIWKNGLWWMRNFPMLVFSLSFPVFILSFFCLTIGHDPRDIPVAVLNYETNNSVNCMSELTCDSPQLSCNYLQRLKMRSLKLIYYSSMDDAQDSVFHGKSSAFLIFKHNYSEALRARIDNWHKPDSWILEFSNIDVIWDVSDKIVGNSIRFNLYNAFQQFLEDYSVACDINPKILKLPITWENPVYGISRPDYTTFVLSGLIIVFNFGIAMYLTSTIMLTERSEGSLERTLVMGITEVELLAGHIICESIIMFIQSTLGVITAYVIFDTTYEGSLMLVLFLLVSVGFCGMNYGIMISSISKSLMVIFFAAASFFFPAVCISGMVWPVEGMHKILQFFSVFLPFTKAIEGLRSILYRNWGLSEEVVYMSFVILNIWTVIFLLLSKAILKFKKE